MTMFLKKFYYSFLGQNSTDYPHILIEQCLKFHTFPDLSRSNSKLKIYTYLIRNNKMVHESINWTFLKKAYFLQITLF